MAFTFDATAAGTTANSYSTVTDALDVLGGRLRVTAFTGETTTTHQIALAMATAQIDTLRFAGEENPPVTNQALKFPRTRDPKNTDGTYKVPLPVRNATIIQAAALLATDAAAGEERAALQAQGVSNYKIGDLSETFRDGGAGVRGVASVITPEALSLIQQYRDRSTALRRM